MTSTDRKYPLARQKNTHLRQYPAEGGRHDALPCQGNYDRLTWAGGRGRKGGRQETKLTMADEDIS